MGKMQRNKGAAGEREFAAMLSAAVGYEVKRKLGAARDGGDDVEYDNFSFEVKRHEAIAIEKWMKQAVENANEKAMVPVVVFRRNHGAWYACMLLDDFFSLIKKD